MCFLYYVLPHEVNAKIMCHIAEKYKIVMPIEMISAVKSGTKSK